MNVDWFQPYKNISYSVGVIFEVIINLPRNIRYSEENVMIIGIIPRPKEAHNSFLGPFVSELLVLFRNLAYDFSWEAICSLCASMSILRYPCYEKSCWISWAQCKQGVFTVPQTFPKN